MKSSRNTNLNTRNNRVINVLKMVNRDESSSSYQRLVLLVAWMGWVFDSMDATIYTLVLHPALHELLPRSGIPPTSEADLISICGPMHACAEAAEPASDASASS